eukprot:m.186207 g.186207  ORF g.186207 m.186207 type:complete len:520 (+) comp10525_c0_seq6:1514-3073(+)
MTTRTYTAEEVAAHNRAGDAWIIVDGAVLDVSEFAAVHPGGRHVLMRYAGRDASEVFWQFHSSSVLTKHGPRLTIGRLAGAPSAETTEDRLEPRLPGTFGDLIPYGDPAWYQRFNSPYFSASHRAWRAAVRRVCELEVFPTITQWRDSTQPPPAVMHALGQAGILAAMCGAPYPREFAPSSTLAPADFDYFHELIVYDELSRCGNAAVVAALTNGQAIALPVIFNFGSSEMKRRVVPGVLDGTKFIALAVSEPQAGSDVAGLLTTAVRDGDSYVLNGNKKWITNGTYADYFVTAVLTGEPGQSGMSFLLVDKTAPGLTVRPVPVRGATLSGTAYLDFDNCRVPVSNLIGKENQGFKLVMYNFNHERFYIATVCNRMARVCLEESIRYALKRKTFGKVLAEHQAIRLKIAAMARQVESMQAWLELMTYQLCSMSHEEANLKIGDAICLLKAHCSKVYAFCAKEATNIFGGAATSMRGLGWKIEPSVAQVKGYQIPAGAEDIMDDYAARAAFKFAKRFARL